MDRVIDGLDRLAKRLVAATIRHARLLGDPESMIAMLIISFWAALAGLSGGTTWVLIAVIVAWFLHGAAVESGSHVSLWLATAGLLILVVVASTLSLEGLPPVLLAAAGTSVLAHNELIRLNYTRRRRAEVDPKIFRSSALIVTIAGVLAMGGVAMTSGLASSNDRTWLWMPVATGVLMVIGLGISLVPSRQASEASRERWLPGARIPPPRPQADDHDVASWSRRR